MSRAPKNAQSGAEVRDKILATAEDLFHKHGTRAVGVDLIVKEAGVAKASLYRHFATKDDLVIAYLERVDRDFWEGWEKVTEPHSIDPKAQLDALFEWVGNTVSQPDYRGCPQIYVAGEFRDPDHPARKFSQKHERDVRRRLKVIVDRLGTRSADELAGQLAVLLNGAFVSAPIYGLDEAVVLLRRAADALISGHLI
jgi:AcrR family transcriptional regulator